MFSCERNVSCWRRKCGNVLHCAYREHRNTTNFPFPLFLLSASFFLPSALISVSESKSGINVNEGK